jgi:hypothetical protein
MVFFWIFSFTDLDFEIRNLGSHGINVAMD